MLKDIWDTVTGNYRFIKYDGSQFHRGKWVSIADRPEMKVGLACIAFNCAVAGYANNDLGHVLAGNFDMGSNLTKDLFAAHSRDFLFGAAYSSIIIQWAVNGRFPKKNKAIDTYGTTLPRAQLSLKDIEGLKNVRLWGGALAVLELSIVGLHLLGNGAHLSVDSAMLFTTCFTAFERSSKILNGQYVICDEPPKKPQTAREKTTVSDGVFSPN